MSPPLPSTIEARRAGAPRAAGHNGSSRWLARWRTRHAVYASLVTGLFAAALLAWPAPGLTAQLVSLAVLLALSGLPHGAADHLPARVLLEPSLGRLWAPFFALGYVGIAALVLFAWLSFPPVALTLFLLLAVHHFGVEDAGGRSYARRLRPLAVLLHGAIPVAGPVLLHVDQTARLFAWLLPGTSEQAVVSVLDSLALGVPALLAAWAFLVLGHLRRGSADGLRAALEIVVLVGLMASAPPLLAFAIYFCGWHSVRHVLSEAAELAPHDPWLGIGRFLRHAAPVTVVSILLAGVAYALVAAGAKPDVALTQVTFIGLAAVAVPHILIRAWMKARTASRPR